MRPNEKPQSSPCEYDVVAEFLEERPVELAAEDQRAFLEALNTSPAPNAALRKLMGGSKRPKIKKK